MNVTCSYKGIVTATGIIGALQKSLDGSTWVSVAKPTVGGTCIEQRPDWNWHRVGAGQPSYTSPANCIAMAVQSRFGVLVWNEHAQEDVFQSTNLTILLDGVEPGAEEYLHGYNDPERPDVMESVILAFGKKFQTAGAHTLAVSRSNASIPFADLLVEYLYSDFHAHYGDTIYYRDTADGIAHPITIDINIPAVAQDMIDWIVSSYTETGDPLLYHDWHLNTLSSCYRMIQDERLRTAASLVFDALDQQCNVEWVPINAGINPGYALTAGRFGMALYQAWLVFGELKYLTACCKLVNAFLSSWPKTTVAGVSGILTNLYAGGSPDAPGNQRSKMLGVSALVYNTASADLIAAGYGSLYHDSGLYDLILNNLKYALGDLTTPRIHLDGSTDYTTGDPDRDYAAFEFPDLLLASQLCNYGVDDVARMGDWLDGLPLEEPFYFYSTYHNQTNSTGKRILAHLANGEAVNLPTLKAWLYSPTFQPGVANPGLPDDDFEGKLMTGGLRYDLTSSSARDVYTAFSEMAATSLGIAVSSYFPSIQAAKKARRIAGKHIHGATIRTR